MSPAELFAQPWCRPVALALMHFLWQGALVATVLAIAVELFGIRKPAVRYAASLAAFLAMIVFPAATIAWLWPAESPAAMALVAFEDTRLLPLAPAGIGAIVTAAQPYLLGLWLVGVSFFAGRLLIGLAGMNRLRRDLVPLSPALASRVRQLGGRLRIDGGRLVHLSRHVSEALAVGLVRPLVLIPAAWATEMPAEMLEAVIAHELAHLRRGDLWINLLQRVVETLLFYHPAVWWLSRRLRVERELCCDELAVAATGRRLEYAQALEHVARRRVARVQPLLAAGIRGEKNMRLLQRVRNVLGLADAADRSRLWPAGIVALALPLAAWAVSSGWATADEERKEGDKPAAERREGDRPTEARKEGEGARPINRDVPREGDGNLRIREGARDGEVRKEGARDGEVRKEGVRDGQKPTGDGRVAELEAALKKLMQQVEYLQKELAAARAGRSDGARKEGEVRREGGDVKKPEIRREGDGVRKEGEVRREGGDVKKPEVRREGDGVRKEGEVRREGGDVKKPELRREGEGERKPEVRKEEPRREGEVRKEGEARKEGDK